MVTEDEIKEELLTRIYERSDPVFVDFVMRSSLIDDVVEKTGADRSEVKTQLKFLGEDGHVDLDPDTVSLNARGGQLLINRSANVPLSPSIQEEILQTLLDEKKRNLNRPRISRDDLLERVDGDQKTADGNVRYLSAISYVEVLDEMGSTSYREIKITPAGRRAL